jgi:radical SAM superfamily enzyme YgiQ (UPF0313 family)
VNSILNEMNKKNRIILLLQLPFWAPQIPPLGISCLKSFLEKEGYTVKTVDANVENQFKDIESKYFSILWEQVPENKRGNFYNIGQDVLRNQMMAYIHYKDKKNYQKLTGEIISKTFFTKVNDTTITRLTSQLEDFYSKLNIYVSDMLEKEDPSLLGLSVNRGNLPASMYTFKLAKQLKPDIYTVIGGPVFSQTLNIDTEDFEYFKNLTKPYIDKIVVGEGEQLFLKLLKGEFSREKRVVTIQDNQDALLDITQAPEPDFSDLNLDFYPDLAAYTSRSCPYQCSFCSETVYWGRYRKKKAIQVVKELTHLYHTYHRQLFLMCDSLLNPIITELAKELTENDSDSDYSIYWDGYLRVDKASCKPENTLQWRRGGLYRVRLGIESGSQEVLRLMGKQLTLEQIRKTISALAEAGIKTTTYWVLGHPGETQANFQETMDLIEDLRDDIYEAWCCPFNYFLKGQVNSSQWDDKSRLLFPEQYREMLVTRTWYLDCEPSRETAYQRMNQFVDHCKKIGVPNPNTLQEIYKADERWKKLHQNSVPCIIEFENKEHVMTENKEVTRLVTARKPALDEGDFEF